MGTRSLSVGAVILGWACSSPPAHPHLNDAGSADAKITTDAAIDAALDAAPSDASPSDARIQPDAEPSFCSLGGVIDNDILDGPGLPAIIQMVANGTGYALVWYEQPAPLAPNPEVWFALADANGNPTTSPVMISPDDGFSSGFPHAAWNGMEYGVVYTDDRASVPGSIHRRIYFARVDAGGSLVSGSEVLIAGLSSMVEAPAIAWDPIDAKWAVAWSDHDSGEVNIAFVSAAGTLSPGTFPVAPGTLAIQGNTPLIWNGTRFAIAVGAEILEVTGAGVANTIATLPGTPALLSTLTWNGSGYGVVWVNTESSTYRPHFGLVGSGGFVPGSDIAIGPTAGVYGDGPAVAWNGSEYAVTWTQSSPGKLWFARVSASAVLVPGSRGSVSCSPLYDMSGDLAWNGSNWISIDTEYDPSVPTNDGHARIIPPSGP
jgi:hypothetical protein